MLMTVVIVISGFIGRYIYTAVPRTVDGAEVTLRDLEHQIAAADAQLQVLGVNRLTPALATPSVPPQGGASLVLGRSLAQWKYERDVKRAIKTVAGAGKPQALQLERLLDERFRLQRQVQSLATARRLLAVWHTIHIPIGVALFIVAFIHIGDTLYYATFIK